MQSWTWVQHSGTDPTRPNLLNDPTPCTAMAACNDNNVNDVTAPLVYIENIEDAMHG